MTADPSLYKTIEFRDAIELGGKTYTTLQLVPPTIKQRRQAEGKLRRGVDAESSTLYCIQLVASVGSVPEGVVEQMHGDQFEEASSWVQDFFDRGRKTGSS